ncbi:hypothetical protein FKW77_008216 [Venturia effusa]|uniref:Uncharacterized protein n=1 Tax=Venturia effusa TaxID=50376 RepID=A0A517LG44_9PEZI|nr:hypothetical protein FKW77_008216 [Venturia effusa]
MPPHRAPDGIGHGLPGPAQGSQNTFFTSLAFRPGPGKRKANDSSGDEAAAAKKLKETPSGTGSFGNAAESKLSATEERAQRTTELQAKYLELTDPVVYPPELGITKQDLVDHFPILAKHNFRARKNMPEKAQFIIFFSNMDKDHSVHDIFTETRGALWIILIASVLYKRPQAEIERLFIKAWYEGRFRKHSFRWRVEYARFWAAHPTEYMPRLTRGLRRKFEQFQKKIEQAVKDSMNMPDKEVLDCAKTYRYLFRNRILGTDDGADAEARKISRSSDLPNDLSRALHSMVTDDEFQKACDYQALVKMGTDPQFSNGVQQLIVDECMEEGDEDIDLIPGLKFRLEAVKSHIETLKTSAEADNAPTVPNERTRINRMTDGDEYLAGAEEHETTVRKLGDLRKDLKKCRRILEQGEDIEDNSVEDDELAVVAQDMILIVEALESVEESGIFDDLLDTAIGADLSTGMDKVQGYLLKHEIFSERDDHEVCTKAMELLDVISRLFGDEEE